jgi:hypothetical protein
MPNKSPINIEIIKENYSQMETESLIKLVSEITSLTPEAIIILQKELLKRGENEQAIMISGFLASPRFKVQEERIISYLLVLRKKGLTETEIDKELKDSFGIDQEYVDYSKARLKAKGRENLIIGIVLIVFPLFLIIMSLILGGYIGFGAVVILGFGVWRLVMGINILRKNPN